VAANRPLIHAGVVGMRGQLLTVCPGHTACYRCIFETPPPPEEAVSCTEAGARQETSTRYAFDRTHERLARDARFQRRDRGEVERRRVLRHLSTFATFQRRVFPPPPACTPGLSLATT
jgi:hypothetical protein